MIRKVAAVQALREAFPQSFAGMYVAEEVGSAEPDHVAGDVIDPQTQPALPQRETVPEQMAGSTVKPAESAGSLEDEFFD